MAKSKVVLNSKEPPVAIGRHLEGHVGRIFGRNGHTLIVHSTAAEGGAYICGCDSFHSAIFTATLSNGPGWSWHIVGAGPIEQPSTLYCYLDVSAITPVIPRGLEEEAWLDQSFLAVKALRWGVQRVVFDRSAVPFYWGKPRELRARHMISLVLGGPATDIPSAPIDLTDQSRLVVAAMVSGATVEIGRPIRG